MVRGLLVLENRPTLPDDYAKAFAQEERLKQA